MKQRPFGSILLPQAQSGPPHLAVVHPQVFLHCAQLLVLVRDSILETCQEYISVVW